MANFYRGIGTIHQVLEILQIELQENYEWNLSFGRSKEGEPEYETVVIPPLELRNWLSQVAQHKASQYTRLKEFAIHESVYVARTTI